MSEDNLLDKIREEAKSYFDNSRGSHGWDHVERVYNLAVHIGKKEGADLFVIKLSALLHDIAREKQDRARGAICHAEEGARVAKDILNKYKVKKSITENVVHSIAAHRFRGSVVPQTIEAKILRDADKLDGTGAVGLGRAFMFAGEVGSKLHNPEIAREPLIDRSYTEDDTAYQEYLFKLKKTGRLMETKEGKKIAKERIKVMADFFDTLNREYRGLG
ncbi:MAG: HD domain-containing protein [Patescibacteria group bacterium]|nr:HD domain-containing protein [Patescibacteria group bacterium]